MTILIAVLTIIAIGPTRIAHCSVGSACSCASGITDEEEIQHGLAVSAAILAAEVISIRVPTRQEVESCSLRIADDWVRDCDDLEVKVRVLYAWRGVARRTLKVWTPRTSPACGYPFRAGSPYLIYAAAFGSDSELVARWCSRTRPLYEAELDEEILGPPSFKPRGADQ